MGEMPAHVKELRFSQTMDFVMQSASGPVRINEGTHFEVTRPHFDNGLKTRLFELLFTSKPIKYETSRQKTVPGCNQWNDGSRDQGQKAFCAVEASYGAACKQNVNKDTSADHATWKNSRFRLKTDGFHSPFCSYSKNTRSEMMWYNPSLTGVW